MSRRPLIVASAATAVLGLCVASSTAGAATASKPAVGKATTSLSLLDLAVGGHDATLATLSLLTDTLSSPGLSAVKVTPLVVDGTAYGEQTIDSSNSPKGVDATSAPSALGPFASLTSPAIQASATDGANEAGADSLGTVSVLGLPIDLDGAMSLASSVSTTKGAAGLKTVKLEGLALPSIADVLGALGLDLSKLPVATLDDLAGSLDLVNGAIETAEGAIDDALDAVDTAQAAVDAASSDLATKAQAATDAATAVTDAQAALDDATSALTGAIGANSVPLVPAVPAVADVASLLANESTGTVKATTLVPALAPLLADYEAADAAVTAKQALKTAADTAKGAAVTALATVTATLETVTAALEPLAGPLVDAIMGVLDSTPLVSLDSLEVSTRAAATSASKGGQHAEVVGGVVEGLKVMGVDVLDAALGTSSLDLTGAVSSALAEVNGVIADVTGTLSDVLSNVPSLPQLDVPAPEIGLLTKSASTTISGGFGRATTAVHGLSISLPAITLPEELAVPGAADLPGLAGVTQTAGQLTSGALSLDLLTLKDQAAFRPAVVASNPTKAPQSGRDLANTGMPAGAATMSLLLVGAGLVLRRRMVSLG